MHTLPFLVAEDDPNDMFLFTRLLKAAGSANALHIALNGHEAIQLLEPVAARSRLVVPPTLVFLDVKMPGRDGFDVLTWMRHHPVLDGIPVVLLSHTTTASELDRATKLRAQCYLKKFPGKVALARLLELAEGFSPRDGAGFFALPENLLSSREPGKTH